MLRSITSGKRLTSALETFVPVRIHASTRFRPSDRTILPQSVNTMYQQKSFRSSRPNQFKPSAPSGYNFQELPADYQRRGQNYSNFMPPEGPNYRAPYRFNIYWNIGLFGALIVMWVSETVEFKKYEYTLEREHLFAQERQAIFTFGNIDAKGI